jgi:D-alanyl-D-alanine carboxypeptidase
VPIHRSISVTAIAIAIATLCAPASGETAKAYSSAALLQCIVSEAQKIRFSGVVSITRPAGANVHAQGVMGGPGSSAIKPGAQFNLGSVGKMFTAVAVAQLVDAGKIALDDPIGRYVDGLTPEASAVTVRQLLTHSGGLGNFFTPDTLPTLQKARGLSDLKPLITDAKPAFAPGSRFQYSNSDFLALGLMIERVSGQSFGTYLDRHVFRPAGMTLSSIKPAPAAQRAIGMTTMPELPPPGAGVMRGPMMMPPPGPSGNAGAPVIILQGPPGATAGPMMPPPGPLRPAAEAAIDGNSASGGYSTAADMQRFFAAFLAGKLTSIPMRDALMAAQIEVSPAKNGVPARYYGLGFGVGSYKGHRWTGHNGGALGVNVEALTFPDDQTTIVIMANRDPPMASGLLRKVQAMVFDGAPCGQAAPNP